MKRNMELGEHLTKTDHKFADIPMEGYFEFQGHLYKKLKHPMHNPATGTLYNTFNLNTGHHEPMKGDCPPYYRVYNLKVEYDVIP